MLGVGYGLYGIGSAISGVSGARSSANYLNIIKKLIGAVPVVGKEIRLCTREVGSETRATIKCAGDVAEDVFASMGREVKGSISHAKECTEGIVRLVGHESKGLAEFTAYQAKGVLSEAERKSQLLLDALRFQMCNTIECAGEEARKTGLALNSNINDSILSLRKETEEVLSNATVMVNAILQQANAQLQGTATNCHKIAIDCIKSLNGELTKSIENIDTKLESKILLLKSVGDAFIMQIGSEGRLLVQEAGLVANQALGNCELLIGEAGSELRLSIDHCNQALRARMWELPIITAKTAHVAGFNLIDGAIARLKKPTFASKYQTAIINKLETMDDDTDIMEMIRDVPRHKLSAQDKYEIYKEFIHAVNAMNISSKVNLPWKYTANLLLQIGIHIFNEDLEEPSGWVFSGTDYKEKLLDEMSHGDGKTEKEWEILETLNPAYVLRKHSLMILDDLNPAEQVAMVAEKKEPKLDEIKPELKQVKELYSKQIRESAMLQLRLNQKVDECERLLPSQQNEQKLEKECSEQKRKIEDLEERCKVLLEERVDEKNELIRLREILRSYEKGRMTLINK